jgi:hypothetical protein
VTRKTRRVRAEPAESADVLFHPSVLEWIRKHAGADFLQLPSRDAAFYLEHGLLQAATGEVVDFETHEPTGQVLYVMTRKALRLAYPDGVDVRRFKCTRCHKETAGRMSRGLGEDGFPVWFPRKHRVDGELCPGNKLEATIVMRRRRF